MFVISSVAAELAAFQDGLSCIELVIIQFRIFVPLLFVGFRIFAGLKSNVF
jgi:hypothetical protein